MPSPLLLLLPFIRSDHRVTRLCIYDNSSSLCPLDTTLYVLLDRDWPLYQRSEQISFGAHDNINLTVYLLTDLREDRAMNLTTLWRLYHDNTVIFQPIGDGPRHVFLTSVSSMAAPSASNSTTASSI